MNNSLVRLFGWHALIFQQVDPCVSDRWRWLRRHLARPAQRTLDAGCGAGEFTLYSARLGNSSVGVSFDERLNHLARERARLLRLANVKFVTADLRELDRVSAQWESFDQIICLETIEHILDDRKLLCDLARLLKANGRLLLTTPFKNSRPLLGDHLSNTEDGGHVRWGYTHTEMEILFAECGLQVIGAEYLSGLVSQQLTNVTRRVSKIHPRLGWAIVLPFRIFQLMDAPLTRWLGYPFLSIGVIGIAAWKE